MKLLSPVVWSEGMYVGPHHFQAQNRYFEDYIRFAASTLNVESFGFTGYALNADALENGVLTLAHARGVFPDGLVFQMPESDDLPPSRDITEDFPPTRDKITVFLAIPAHRPGERNCSDDHEPAAKTRFSAEIKLLPDETTGRDEKPVRLGKKNISFQLDTEDGSQNIRLPVVRVMRSGSGRFAPDPSFIPPCLDFSASDRLMAILGRLIEILEDRGSSLSLAAGQQAGFSTQELARFWLLHTINSSLAQFRHLYYAKRGHPEELYLEMLRIGGALCTFALKSHPRLLPVYNHLAPGECFDRLDAHIREHLEIVLPTTCIRIELRSDGDYFYFGDLKDQRCVGKSSWIFAIRSGGGDASVIARVPGLVKICSRSFVPELVKRALPGFELRHLQTPPAAISVAADTQYFVINKSGPCWGHVVKTRQVGVYVPGEFPDAEVELLVLPDVELRP